ncbi:unnamed protein product [marine sediment metagenome]|uniref:OsmC family protein n=1 Tax=marine sediment metagenome TaxID=412755 RepID=X0ZNG7_9ZZZZ
MARLSVSYGGGKRFMAEVRGHRIECDQREKGGGQDSAPEPFDLFVASHAMCMMLFAQIFLERNELSTEGLSLDVEYEMADHPRRLGKVHGILHVPNAELGKRAKGVVRSALACPVHHSIREDTEITLELAR